MSGTMTECLSSTFHVQLAADPTVLISTPDTNIRSGVLGKLNYFSVHTLVEEEKGHQGHPARASQDWGSSSNPVSGPGTS